jgi:hypothetical protein
VTLEQGATRTIVVSGLVDANGATLDVTGWSVRAQIRPSARSADLLAEWVTGTPTSPQGQATAAGQEIRLVVPPAMSEPWTWGAARLGVEITEPATGRRERFDAPIVLDPEIVR